MRNYKLLTMQEQQFLFDRRSLAQVDSGVIIRGAMKPMIRAIVVIVWTELVLCGAQSLAQVSAANGAQSIFQVVATPNENFDNNLQAASASSPTDIWAVGESTIHYNGTKWTAYEAPMISGNFTGFLGGVVDISPTVAWAAGTINIGEANPGQVIEFWNGTKWSVYPGPTFAAGDQPSLYGMTSTSANDIWAVGSLLSNADNQIFALFEHWDGTNWQASTVGAGVPFLQGTYADAKNDAWAVGYNAEIIDENVTLAMHWNGTNWTQVSTPNTGEGDNELNGVVALSPDNVWAVGDSTPGLTGQSATVTLVEHYNGKEWSIVPSPNVGPANQFQSNRLFGITGTAANDLWAFGSYFASDGSGHQMTLLLHWNGTDWKIVPSPNPTKSDFLSDLLWAGVEPSAGNVWIFGTEDVAPNEETLAIHSIMAK